MSDNNTPWSDERHQLLVRMLDQLIPASPNGVLPSAGQLGVGDFLVKRAEDTPGLATLFCTGLDAADTLVAERGGSSSEPGGSSSEPGGSGAQPGGSGAQPAGSGAQPAGSGAQPAGSGAQPAGSGADGFSALGSDERDAVLFALQAQEPAFFAVFLQQSYMGYYTHPSVPPNFGLPDRPPQPLGHKLPPNENLDELVSPVKERGKCYREC